MFHPLKSENLQLTKFCGQSAWWAFLCTSACSYFAITVIKRERCGSSKFLLCWCWRTPLLTRIKVWMALPQKLPLANRGEHALFKFSRPAPWSLPGHPLWVKDLFMHTLGAQHGTTPDTERGLNQVFKMQGTTWLRLLQGSTKTPDAFRQTVNKKSRRRGEVERLNLAFTRDHPSSHPPSQAPL